ncbi:hypothetical protein PF005_g23492 [Phytophthora fragariae]|uniref:Crinkler effector protein N-terminal domain-containing protein n=2 Tax=Phytophthora fragariae TaxID=53985 RepID=A0A6A4DSQ6_9STRA|nr:hypothetical protein PF003_g3692 [Phytophthora fragariae]KAE8925575.1 hypothetical protein PF009_g24219 [Phytophthora fragariae]KAE8973286.1 hypothetical protein PF011_g25312 [Phytophthora fragariae]KAE9071266.1 hypothetical protein PF010_g25937 [Phytophthora fragariae]KAE9178518.1 hypothetical protein PF004_g25458 [Phytophthora fragariae]
MVLLQLVCVLLREGSMFLVEIDDNQRVLALKDSIKKQKPDTITVEADQLQLFLAKGEDGNWLGDDTDLVRQLMRGEVPQGIQALTDGGEEIMPSKTIIHWLQKKNLRLPSCDQIHVLVYMPPKRRRLENVNKLADIPQINIQGVSYVTLPGELVAKCGLTPGGDLMLYCRPQVHKLWRFLRDDVIVKGIRGWILGPPGTGKSASLLSFAASLDPQEWNVVWIHLDEKGDLCVSMGSKQHWMVDDRSTFELRAPLIIEELFLTSEEGLSSTNF